MRSGLNAGLEQVEELKKEITRLKQELKQRKKSEEQLKENEEKFSAAFLTNPNALVLSFTENGTIIDVNEAFVRLFGIEKDEVKGKTSVELKMFAHPEDRDKLTSIMRSEGRIRNHEVLIRTNSGEERYTIISSELLSFANRKTMLTTIQDITDRKIMEQSLRRSEQRYRELVESANSIILRYDISGKITFANNFAASFFGYETVEMTGKNVMMIVPGTGKTGKDLAGLIKNIISDPQNYQKFENENVKRSGELVWINWTNRAILDENGNVQEILAIGNDITERKKAEDKLKIEHSILDAVVSNIGTGLVVSDMEGNILSLNDAAQKMHDFRSEDEKLSALGQYMKAFSLEYPDGKKVPLDNWPLSLALKGVYFRDYIVKLIRHKDDSYRFISYNTVPIYNEGKAELIIITMTDNTEIYERAQELEESELRYQSLFNNSTLGIAHCRIIMDEEGKPSDYVVLQVNNAYSLITGIKKEDIEGKNASQVFTQIKNYPYNYLEKYIRIAFEGGELSFESYLEPFEKWLSVYAYSPKKGEFTAMFTDVSERKKIEAEALARATEIEAILSCIAEGVIVYDKEGTIIRSNEAARKIMKYDDDQKKMNLTERAKHGFRMWTEDGRLLAVHETPAYRSTMEGETIVNELLLVRTREEKMWLNLSAAPLIISGRHSGGVVSMADITRRKQMEDNLARERELFEGIFNNIPVMITIFDPAMKHFRFNREFKNVLGWTEKDAEDGKLMEKVYPDNEYRKNVIKFMQSLEPGWLELKSTAKGGDSVDSTWANVYLSSGLLLGIGIDIRKRKEAEETLRRSEQRLQGIFNDVAIGIIEVDHDDRIITVNQRVCEILGYTNNELIGKTISEITAPEDRELSGDMNKRLHKGEFSIFDYEKRYIRKDGRPLWVHLTVSAVRNSKGEHINSIGTVEDISERRMAIDALRQSEEKFRSLFENITEGVALHELVYENGKPVNYRIIDINPAFIGYTGVDPLKAVGSLATEAYDSKEPPFLEEYAAVAITGIPYRFETFWEPMNKHFVISAISPGKDRFATVFEDITEQKKSEIEIRQKNEELTRFIYTVSHDLKSPLVTIKSFTNYLKEDIEIQDKEAQNKDINYIQNAADKMGKLLDELLELSRIGRKEKPKSLTPLKIIVQSAIDLVAGRLEEKKINVFFSGPDVLLYGHSQRFIQLYQNLIDNAAKFMSGQTDPKIEIGSFIDKENNDDIVLFVRDNGSGIDPRYHHKIFGLFEKMDNTTEGTGIGLALVKRIIEVHGGTVWFFSEGIGKGTTFYFRIEGTRLEKLNT